MNSSRHQRLQWILFDLDHTLLDFDASEAQALHALCINHGLNPSEQLLQGFRRINSGLWRMLEEGRISSADLRIERFSRCITEFFPERSKDQGGDLDSSILAAEYLLNLQAARNPMPGSLEVLEALQGRFSLAALTNGIRETQFQRLKIHGMEHYFHTVLVSEDAPAPKPDPRFFAQALSMMKYPDPSRCLMIGDNLRTDIRGAQDSGIPACWYNPSGRPRNDGILPEYEIVSLKEILDLPGINSQI